MSDLVANPITDRSLADALTAVPALSQVAHLHEYFGVWAVHETSFRAVVDRVTGMDLAAHVAGGLVSKRRLGADAETDEDLRPMAAAEAGVERVRVQRGYSYDLTPAGVGIADISGTLMKFASSMDEATSSVAMRRTLRAMQADERVKSVIVQIDSPGGTVAGTADLAGDLAALSQVKPTVAYVDSLGASAAYWVASQARRIVAGADAMVGSIGTFAVLHDLSGLAAREGIKVHVVRAGAFKGAGTPGTEIAAPLLADMQRLVDGLNAQFLDGVARGRRGRMTSEQVAAVADGRVHLGADAKTLGLIDAVGTFDAVLAEAGTLAKSTPARIAASAAISIDPPTSTEKPPMAETSSLPASAPAAGSASPAPKAATLKELKAAIPDATAEFREECVEKDLTLAQAKDAWMDHLRAQNENLRSEVENGKAAAPSAKGPAGSGMGKGKPAAEQAGDPIAAWNEAIKTHTDAGKAKADAIRAVVASDPDLHQSYLAAVNANRRPRSAA